MNLKHLPTDPHPPYGVRYRYQGGEWRRMMPDFDGNPGPLGPRPSGLPVDPRFPVEGDEYFSRGDWYQCSRYGDCL